MTSVFRFAPSPNGALHLGHAYSALLNRRMADACGGVMLLRIEDIDTVRCTPALEQAMVDDLAWLGVTWDAPPRRQSLHFADYADALNRLAADGLVYPAFMSRGAIRDFVGGREERGEAWPRDPDGAPVYPGVDRELDDRERRRLIGSGTPYALRVDMARALAKIRKPLEWVETGIDPDAGAQTIRADPAAWGDVILARRETPTSYHLSVVVDDALQGVTDVVRGRDLFAATSVHVLLQALLDLPTPRYHHHRLLPGPDGRKLSKSIGDTGIAALREAGLSPADVARLAGLQA